jgi:outer membrane protein OmpA-like peptidoglycan-associated protein
MNSKVVFGLAWILLLSGCGSQPVHKPSHVSERIILLPSQTDRPSAVVVKSGDSEILLDRPYASTDSRAGVLASGTTTADEVTSRYGKLLAAQPPKPHPFTVYFQLGTDDLTGASKIAFEEAKREIASWAAAEVVVIGHTDRLGSLEYNDALSKQRAQMVARRLVSSGVPSDIIIVAARGEREPLVATRDGAPEPRNRRVEIKVR